METAEKVSITMTPEMLREIRESVEAGDYASTSEAMRDAVRVWKREREEHRERIAAIRARIHAASSDPRADLTGDEVAERLKALFDRAEAKSGRAEF